MLGDPLWKVRSPYEAAGALSRFYDLFIRFLLIVGLSSLLVGGVGISNAVSVTEKLTLTGTIDFYSADYYVSSPKRDDTNVVLRALASYVVNENWSALADIGFTNNNSTISTSFKYERWVGSAGASYTF